MSDKNIKNMVINIQKVIKNRYNIVVDKNYIESKVNKYKNELDNTGYYFMEDIIIDEILSQIAKMLQNEYLNNK